MTRPSRNQDQILIETAKKLLPKVGISGISMKQVADASGVNLGMFHYYFGSRKKFVQKVLESLSGDILDEVEQKSLQGKTSMDRLRAALMALGSRVRDHREIFTSMIQDILNRDKDVSNFIAHFMTRELNILVPLFEEAQKDGSIEPFPLRQCLAFCMSSISMPTLAGEAFARISGQHQKFAASMDNQMTSDESIQQRIDMALKALSTHPRKVL